MVAARRCLGLNQRLGLSRNKVAVPEGVAGTPPFWSLRRSRGLLSYKTFNKGNTEVIPGLIAQLVRALH